MQRSCLLRSRAELRGGTEEPGRLAAGESHGLGLQLCVSPRLQSVRRVQGRVRPEETQSRGGGVRDEGDLPDVDTRLPPVSQKKASGQ